ncbi:MAG: MarR family transcriptional regulator [Betaproteobacteria bacterium]|nr:MAG: MarR family transcriptional regulator [Betaproteobacteria bacterium]TMI07549.1 MAG: MarR family transcriptional regulator [Betaproteobacteria bacterium]
MESESSIGRMLNRVRAELVEALDRELAPFEITSAQFVILGSLVSGDADSASALCKEISYDPGAMTRMIDRLELKGLIRRLPHADDRRRMNLELTPKGKAVYPKLRASAVTVQNRFLRGFTKIEARQLEGFLQRMIASASQSRYETEE